MNELLTVLIIGIGIIASVITVGGIINPRALRPEEERNKGDELSRTLNQDMICPHCQRKGQVRVKDLILKKGISGGKAVAAVFTAGISLIATGILRKEQQTHAHCGYCNSVWYI